MKIFTTKKHDLLLIVFFSLFTAGLYLLPTAYDIKDDGVRCKSIVREVDSSEVQTFGHVRQGDQQVVLEITDGPYAGKRVDAYNQLLGQLDRDKFLKAGDEVYTVLTIGEKGKIIFANPQAHYRIDLEFILFALFAAFLLIFGGLTGLKSLLSFIFTGMMIWKVFIPALLAGNDPVWLTLAVVGILSAVIIFMVAGINRTGLTAFTGAFSGVLASCCLAYYFTGAFYLHGAVMPFSEPLLYSGYAHLDLTAIFTAGVFLASSGAVMDLGMDIAASISEVVSNNPDISRGQAIWAGIHVGRAVVGTMTTTLLLAYSGGYVMLLMTFMAQGIPLESTLNFVYVSSEVLKTLVGSFGLVLVAPFTAIMGGLLLTKKRQ